MNEQQQQQADYELVTAIWHILKDFGSIKNTDDIQRFEDLSAIVEYQQKKFPEAHKLFFELHNIIGDRSVKNGKTE